MKNRILTVLSIASVLALGCTFTSQNSHASSLSVTIPVDSKVYVCGGKYAKKFHSRSDCPGLNNCKSDIYYYESQEAAKKAGYDYCQRCWK